MKYKHSIFTLLFLSLSFYDLSAQSNCDTLFLKSGTFLFIQNHSIKGKDLACEVCDDTKKTYIIASEQISHIAKYQALGQGRFISDSLQQYKVWLRTQNDQIIKGQLVHLKDSSLSIHTLEKEDIDFPVSHIKHIKLRRKGKRGKAAVVGMIVGATIGFATHKISLNRRERKVKSDNLVPFSRVLNKGLDKHKLESQERFIFTSLGAISGAIIGSVIGNFKLKISINGNHAKYKKAVPKIRF